MADGYDPHENRNPMRPTTNVEVLVHIIKTTFGIGVLGLPYAISQAGYIIAICVAIPAILIMIYCVHILIRTMYKICKLRQEPYITFEDCMEYIVSEGPKRSRKCAKFWKYFVKVMLISYPVGLGTAYTIFIAQSINNVFPLLSETKGSLHIYEALLLIPLFIINCLPNLHRMAFFAILGNIITLICVIGLLYLFYAVPPLISGEHHMIGSPLNIMMFLGIVLFSLEGISVIISIEEHMKTPKSFLGKFGLFNLAMIITLSFYLVIAVTGYLKFGDTVMSSVNMNLPQTWIAQSIKYMLILCIYYSYPIQNYPVITFVWEHYLMLKTPENKRTLYEYFFKFGLTLVHVILAMIVPKLDVVLSLVGGICTSLLGYFFPALMEYNYNWKMNEGRCNFTMVKDVFLMMWGLGVTLTVTVSIIVIDVGRSIESLKEKQLIPLEM